MAGLLMRVEKIFLEPDFFGTYIVFGLIGVALLYLGSLAYTKIRLK